MIQTNEAKTYHRRHREYTGSTSILSALCGVTNERNVCGRAKVMGRPLRCRLRSLFCPANDTSRQS